MSNLGRYPLRCRFAGASSALLLVLDDNAGAAAAVATDHYFGDLTNVVEVAIADAIGSVEGIDTEQYRAIDDTVAAADAVSYLWGPAVSDRINLADAAIGSVTMLALAADSVTLSDAIALAWDAAVSDTVQAADSSEGLRILLAIVADAIRASDASATQLTALAAVVAGVSLADQVGPGYTVVAADTVNLTESMVATATLLANLADTITVADDAAGAMRITALLEDTAAAADATATQLTAFQAIADGLRIAVTVRIGEDTYYAYVLHPEPIDRAGTRPITQYQNYPFNSFATSPQKRQYAAGPGGIYLLEGDDDAGEPIDAWMTLAMTRFGGNRSRLPEMFLAIRARDNAVFLKVVHVDLQTNRKIESWYDVKPGPDAKDALRNVQVKLQEGVKAVSWQVTLRNKGGEPFELSELKFFPVILDRS